MKNLSIVTLLIGVFAVFSYCNHRGDQAEIRQLRQEFEQFKTAASPSAGANTAGSLNPDANAPAGESVSTRKRHDFRELQRRLPGLGMQAIKKLLGAPDKVSAVGSLEFWSYKNIAFDPVLDKPIGQIGVNFRDGVVQSVDNEDR